MQNPRAPIVAMMLSEDDAQVYLDRPSPQYVEQPEFQPNPLNPPSSGYLAVSDSEMFKVKRRRGEKWRSQTTVYLYHGLPIRKDHWVDS